MVAGSFRRDGWAVAAVLLLAVALRAWMFSIFDISHADEFMQYLEQGNRLATGHGIVPWEVRYGARNAVIPQLLAGPLWLGHALWPGTLGAVWLARGLYAGLCGGLTLVAAWRIGMVAGRVQAFAALVAAAVWWESVVFTDLLLSDSLSAPLLLLAAPALLDRESGARARFWAGLLLGLAVLARFQSGLFAAVLVVAALRWEWRRWGPVVAGGLMALALGAASDLASGHVPFGWVWQNLAMNVGAENRAARFGAEPAGFYLATMWVHMGPAAVFVVLGAVCCPARLRPVLAAALVHLAAHSLLAHKEFRFVWPAELSFVVLARAASAGLAGRLVAGRGAALVVAGWCALSALAVGASGGAGAVRGGGAISRVAQWAAARGATCGIALPNQWRAHLVPAMLPREIPLYVAPAGVAAGDGTAMVASLPADLAAAANAAILPSAPANPGWQAGPCIAMSRGRACLYLRAGACRPAAYWAYPAALAREDL